MSALRAAFTVEASAAERRALQLSVLGAVLVLGAIHHKTIGPATFAMDDPYIVLHGAEVLRGGSDTAYVGVPALAGSTSPVHLVLVWALLGFVTRVYALYAASWIGALAYGLSLARLASAHRLPIGTSLVFVASGTLAGGVQLQLLNGLETGLAMAMLTLAIAEATDGRRRSRWLAPLSGTLPFVRPELALAAPLLLAARALARRTPELPRGSLVRALARDVALAAASALPWAVLALATTGSLLPGSVDAKRAFFAEGCLPAGAKLAAASEALASFTWALGPLALAWALLLPARSGWAALVFVAGFLGAYYVALPGALSHYGFRYLFLVLPFLLHAVASCAAHARRELRVGAVAILLLSLAHGGALAPSRWRASEDSRRVAAHALESLGTWCRAHLPRRSRVLVHDAGYLSVTTDLRLFDMVGLKTPWVVDEHRKATLASCGATRHEALDAIARKEPLDYLVVSSAWDRLFAITDGLRSHGWVLSELRRDPDAFYRVYQVERP